MANNYTGHQGRGRTEMRSLLDSNVEQAQIEDYLDPVCPPLVDLVPYEMRLEPHRDMRTHLQ